MSAIEVRVARRRVEAEDVVSFDLRRVDGAALPAAGAGAHIDVHLPDGRVRQYSLCGDLGDRDVYRIAVLRHPQSRGGSVALHDHVREGDRLTIGAPRNRFGLLDAPRTLLFAGGIGITPLFAMAQRLVAWGADFELHYCTRPAARTAFADALAAERYAGRVHLHHDDGPDDRKLRMAELLAPVDAGTQVYACGPAGYIAAVIDTARALGWPEAQLHWEHFAAPADTAGDASRVDAPFELRLARRGLSCRVPADRSIVQALRSHGIELAVACEQGLCGTCVTGVLEGVPDHRDVYLTDEEKAANDRMTPCCSRARTAVLVLDL